MLHRALLAAFSFMDGFPALLLQYLITGTVAVIFLAARRLKRP